ncbi:2Fe-2S iron-sulfur cluster binding domain-containing protein [Ramlibacter sp. AW1]|uniref:2Fe-2S iron-sulfur cluster binding domain-containing protein n=1 Tax=Ramlibacter aurantiacus TaxID=2801330 RepID=A0A936ZT23_9BURK|nr:2Fe-2S iron-sulfur cluster-binding protein [Ramlibacter aurantiacus]MBL0422958.1 2Fe-2S iron-sulfur cluster binding domain-containing protein [Ramlibacter aurantiacus]
MNGVNLTYRLPDGTERTLRVPAGTSAMRAAVDAGLPGIVGECGGSMMCATCHVYVEGAGRGDLEGPSEQELAMLDFTAAERRPHSRLGCQLPASPALEGLVLVLPECQA